jgi:DNA-binding PadR family transcriptional regulator
VAVREGLLLLLRERPRHGYDLRSEFESRTASLWRLNSGQVYTTLERLERDGLVVSEPDDDDPSGRRRLYQLTPAGLDEVAAWYDAPAPEADPPRDDLVMKVLLAAQGERAEALGVVDRHRHALLTRLQDLRRQQRGADDGLAGRLVADVLAARLEADLRWLDLTEERLRAQPAQNPAKAPADATTYTATADPAPATVGAHGRPSGPTRRRS